MGSNIDERLVCGFAVSGALPNMMISVSFQYDGNYECLFRRAGRAGRG